MRSGFMLAVLLCCSAAAQAAECVKTVRWNPDRGSSALQAAGGVEPSFNRDMVVEVLRRMGCSARFVGMPWARALIELENGKLDILPGAFENDERKRYARFSVQVMHSPNVLFMAKSAADKYSITKLGDVTGTSLRLGFQICVSYGQAVDKLSGDEGFKARLVNVSSRESAWQMMALGRLDGLIADETVGLNEIRDLGLQQAIVKTPLVVANDASRVAFSKKSISPQFVQQFDSAFSSMLADGSYKKIREAYVPCAVAVEKLGCK